MSGARLLRVGLTGGIASGKSTVAAALRGRGATVIDADRLAREALAPGSEGLAEVAARFGPDVLGRDGALDRAALAGIVFADAGARAALEAVVHPRVQSAAAAIADTCPSGTVLVEDIPLLTEKGYAPRFHAVLVTEAPLAERVRRMVTTRGMTEADARARIASQASDEQRRAVADVLLPGDEDVAARLRRVDRLWDERLAPWARNLAAGVPVRRPAAVTLVPHDPAWRLAAARQLRRFRYALDTAGLAGQVMGLDHIGSTSVAGLDAKPVLDLQLRVRSLAPGPAGELQRCLAGAGFFPRGDGPVGDYVHAGLSAEPEQWSKLIYLGTDPAQVYHLHVRRHDSAGARLALLMRDYLRAHPDEAAGYLAVKRAAATQAQDRREAYTPAKAPWFRAAVPRALVWAEQAGWRGPGPG